MASLIDRVLNRVSNSLSTTDKGPVPFQFGDLNSIFGDVSGLFPQALSTSQRPSMRLKSFDEISSMFDPSKLYPQPGLTRNPGETTGTIGYGASKAQGYQQAQVPGLSQIPDTMTGLRPHLDLLNEFSQSSGVPAIAYAASIMGESGGDPFKDNNSGSGAYGLFQAHPMGRGRGYTRQQLSDPRFQFQIAAPEFQAAYRKAQDQGFQGPDLIGATIAYAQRYEGYADPATGKYNPGSQENQYFRRFIDELWKNPQALNPAPAPAARGGPGSAYRRDNQLVDDYSQAQLQPMSNQPSLNQYELGLPKDVADAFCGPTAVMTFMRYKGRTPTLDEALNLASRNGWSSSVGMGTGPQGVSNMLSSQGINNDLQWAVNWDNVRYQLGQGRPVIIDTPGNGRDNNGHYFVATAFDPQTGMINLGGSAQALRASGGRQWFRPEEIVNLGFGSPRATIFLGD